MRVQTAEVDAGEGDTRHLFVRCLFLALGPRVPTIGCILSKDRRRLSRAGCFMLNNPYPVNGVAFIPLEVDAACLGILLLGAERSAPLCRAVECVQSRLLWSWILLYRGVLKPSCC